MKKKIDIKSMVLGALMGMSIIISVAAATEDRNRWEYRVVTGLVVGPRTNPGSLEESINGSVAQGWSFVTASGAGERSGFAVMRREKDERN